MSKLKVGSFVEYSERVWMILDNNYDPIFPYHLVDSMGNTRIAHGSQVLKTSETFVPLNHNLTIGDVVLCDNARYKTVFTIDKICDEDYEVESSFYGRFSKRAVRKIDPKSKIIDYLNELSECRIKLELLNKELL